MAQCLRVYKPNIVIFARSYSTQRQNYTKQQNYYDVLNISPNASQKEIRQAFITMSKKTHPDVSGKDGHATFVKINEAYNTLSKEDSRYQYDMSLRYSKTPSNNFMYYEHGRPTVMYRNLREWEEAMAGAPRMNQYHGNSESKPAAKVIFILFVVGFVLHGAAVMYSMSIRQKMLKRSNEYAEILQKVRKDAKNRTPEEEREFIRKIQNQFKHRRQPED